jgi:hypothetical protein
VTVTVESVRGAARPTPWQLAWITVLTVYLVLSLIWLSDLCPRPLLRWFNENYEHLYTQGPPLALSFWRTGGLRSIGLQLYGLGTLCLLGLGYAAYRAVRVTSRVLLGSLFVVTWVFWGLFASAPWY